MTSEWDGTPWSGTAVAVATNSLPIPHDGMAQVAKAATGWQTFYNGVNQPLSSVIRSPAKVMREAQALYYSHPWIRRAESTVTSKVANLPWHIEDGENEVDDETPNPALKAVRDLLEKPQAALPPEQRQPGLTTRRGLVSITSRHMGLCALAHWYLDQMDTGGIPLALLYINPARMTPDTTKTGQIVGWRLDADDYGNGGTPLRVDQVLTFYLEVPDGPTVAGLVAAAALKARIVTSSDVHALEVIGTGGRIAGLVSPKQGGMEPEDFAQMERDFRTINEAPDAAKRTTILRGPVDFTKTAADPSELGLIDLGKTSKEDIFAIWGVPPSQSGIPHASGLNAGTQGANEYEVLMSGPVHDRVTVIRETIQYDLLDRWVGVNPQLVIEEPEFDDDAPAYQIAASARELPLTNNDRRKLIGLDPLPEYGPDGEPLGLAILLPSTLTTWAQGPEDGASPDNPFPNAPQPAPKPVAPPSPFGVSPISPQAQLGAGPLPAPAVAKASLRSSIDTRVTPVIRKAMQKFLAEQRIDIVARLRSASARQLKDDTFWFRGDAWDKALAKTLRPHLAGIAETVTVRTAEMLAPRKAKPPKKVQAAVAGTEIDPFTAKVEQHVLAETGLRIAGINETTRLAVADVIRAGIAESLTASEIADRIEQLPAFDEARAELVARTETGFAYNSAAITSYRQYGVEQVQAIDGDQDEVCADRNGRVFTVDEADGIEDHPNGTLDWVPYFAAAA